jgi:patatin-like phospholipase/acyl hydrolase
VKDDSPEPKVFRVLSLDGGGAKGFYTLGALMEIEALVGCRLCEKFNLIYGTSTGAIITALLGLGKPVDEIESRRAKILIRGSDLFDRGIEPR